MAKNEQGILAVYKYLDEFTAVIEELDKRDDCEDYVAYSHTSYHELMDLAEKRHGVSPIRFFTLAGGLTGCATGFAMPLWMDYDWPMIVGGKQAGILSLPAYFIFGFELMVLLGALATIFGMLWFGKLANPFAKIRDPRLTDDRFAIFVPGATIDGPQASLLSRMGAEEVRIED